MAIALKVYEIFCEQICMTDGWMDGKQKAIYVCPFIFFLCFGGWRGAYHPAEAGPEVKKKLHAEHEISTVHKIKNAEK